MIDIVYSVLRSFQKPKGERIYTAARTGKHRLLKDLLKETQRNANSHDIEYIDIEGKTPLIIATIRNQIECVNLLLEEEAKVNHCSECKEGGTALHEAIANNSKQLIDILLHNGANPFLENICGLTPMDFARRRKDVGLVRKLEKYAAFSSYLYVRMPGFARWPGKWCLKWAVVLKSMPCPLKPENEQFEHRQLLLYTDANCLEPDCKLFIDGANSQIKKSRNQELQCVLSLHEMHACPKHIYYTGNNLGRYTVYFLGQIGEPSLLEKFNRSLVTERKTNSPVSNADRVSMAQDMALARALHESLNAEAPLDLQQQYSNYMPVDDRAIGMGTRRSEEGGFIESKMNSKNMLSHHKIESEILSASLKSTEDTDIDSMCIICMDKPKTHGFIHENSVHGCVCEVCANILMKSKEHPKVCPICRLKIEAVVKVF